jgi:hypothetical protein
MAIRRIFDYHLLMPEISRFLGIVIALFYRDHVPPHFHAVYGDYQITIDIDKGTVEGRFPKRALQHVLEWHELHKQELLDDWELARNKQPLKQISPLE